MRLLTAGYLDQVQRWPAAGRHILAQFDDKSIIVYQAFRLSIARFAPENGFFGGEFSYSRMSWIKPNFLWMMYRSGWGTKKDQQSLLGLRLRRSFFDKLLADAVPSTWDTDLHRTEVEWKRAAIRSSVRVQWDPDHNPTGGALERRAIQLGLRGAALEAFGRRELLDVIDMTSFVTSQRETLASSGIGGLVTPRECVYRPSDTEIIRKMKQDGMNGESPTRSSRA